MNRSRHLLNITIVILAIVILAFTACVRRVTNRPPSAVINIYPDLSELVDENNFYAKWTQSVDPEGGTVKYMINYAKTMEGLDDPQFFETTENYFLLPNLSKGVWYWQVTAIDSACNETQSPIWNFTINGVSLPQPTNPEDIPPDPSLIVSQVENTSFTLDWPAYEDKQDPSKQIQYIVNVYDKGSFSDSRSEWDQQLLRTVPATTAHTTDTSHTFNHMKSQTLYDWVIIAQSNASQTSVVGSSGVKTGNRAPSKPELLTPTDEATSVATDVTLSWAESTDPDDDEVKYYVYIDIVKNTNRNATVEGIEATSYQPDGLETGRTYYWFILVKDSNAAATRTQTQAFMTQSDGMDVPHSPTPADNSQNINAVNPPELQWQHNKNNQPINYNVYLSDNPKKITLEAEGLSLRNYQIPNKLKGNTKYYWQVEAIDSQSGQTTRSGVWTFKTAVIDPPTQTSAQTNTDGTQIEITYNKAMADPEGKHSQYTVKKEQTPAQANRPTPTYQTIPTSKIAIKPGTTNIYVLTLESKLNDTDNIKIDYTQGTIQAKDGGKLQSYQNYPVMNKVPGEAPKVTSSKTLVTGNATQTNQIQIQFDKAMKAPANTAANQFSLLANGNTQAIDTIVQNPQAPQQYILTLTGAIVYGQSLSLNYTKGSVQATNEAYLESFAGQPVANTVNPVAPKLEEAQTTDSGQQITLTFDKTMQIEGDQAGQFRVTAENTTHPRTGQSVTAATVMSDEKKIALTLQNRIEYGQTIEVSYTPGTIKSQEGAQLQAFTQTVTNAVSEPPRVVQAYTNTTGEIISVEFTKTMNDPSSQQGAFDIDFNRVDPRGDAIESIGLNPSNDKVYEITLKADQYIGNGDNATLTYERGDIESTDEGWLNTFNQPIINNVTGDAPRLLNATMSENGTTLTASFDMYMEELTPQQQEQFAIRVAGKERTIDNITRSNDEKTYTFTIEEAALYQQRVTLVYLKGTVKAKYGTYLESFTREAANLVKPVGPEVQSVETNTRGDWITLTFDKAMEAPAASEKDNFSLSLNPPANAQRIGAGIDIQSATLSNTDATLMGLKLTGRIEYNTSWNLTYNPGAIETTEGATLAAFNKPVTNNTPVEPTVKDAYSSEDGQTITVRFSKDMKDDPKKDGFSVSVQAELNGQRTGEATITDIERDDVNDRLYNLTLEQALDDTDVATLIYARQHNDTDVESLDDGWLNNFTQTIRNGVPPEKPLCLSATMTADGKQVELGFDKEMVLDDPEEKQYQQFGVLVEGYVNEITAATLKAGHPNIIVLTLAIPVGKNNEVHVSYTRGTVKSENGGELESFQNKRVNTDNLDVIWVEEDIGWNYSKIQEAIDAAEDEAIVMVWPGHYTENLTIEKPIHLMSSDPASETIQESTIIDANEGAHGVAISSQIASSGRGISPEGTVTIEGFTITNAMSVVGVSSERNGQPEIAAGIKVNDMNTIIRNNIITENGTTTIGEARGITVDVDDETVEINNNTISYNYLIDTIRSDEVKNNGAGIYVKSGSPLINNNVIDSNETEDYGGAIALETEVYTSSTRLVRSAPAIYNNTMSNNKAQKGAGIYINHNMAVQNADGTLWKRFNVPAETPAFVERNSDDDLNNTYENNQLLSEQTGVRTNVQDGTDICYESAETPEGTLTLRPEEGEEQSMVTLNIDYQTGMEFKGGTLTIQVPTGFEITANASVTIEGQSAVNASDYNMTEQRIDINGIDLEEEGTITLTLEEQEIPDGVTHEINSRALDYELKAYGDADGTGSAWHASAESNAVFTSTPLSTNTDFNLIGEDPQLIQYNTESPDATSLKVASETTVERVLANIESADGSNQTHSIYTSSPDNPLQDSAELTEEATLLVISEHGESHQREYKIIIHSTPFVKLYSQPRVLSGQRENRQGEYVTTWHDTISDAVTNAHPTDLSSITVWQGTYVENIDFGDKELHVTNTSPTDHEVRENTQIIAADQTIPVVRIAGDQMETILEGFQITCDGTGVYCEEVTPVIRNNNIFYENSCAVELKRSNATLYNNNLISDKITVYMTDSEPEIHDNTIEGTDRAIEVVNSTPTVYDNVFLTLNKPGNGVYVDINSNVKNEEENLWQVFNVPYVKQADVENYTDGATSNTFTSNAVVASVRNVNPVEGQYIKFERVATHTKDGTFTLSPATAASNDGEDITIIATYTLAESFSNGTVTYVLDPAIDMDEVYITINGNRRAVTDEEKVLSGQNSQVRMQELNKINIKDICAEANEKIVLEIIQSSYLFEQEIFSGSERNGYLPNQNGMFVQVDRDGLGSLYTASDPEVGSVDIENNLEYIGSEATAYGITDNGETFYSYTVKVFKDKMPEKLRTIPEWEIEIRGTSEGTYYFRANQFNENVLQCDEIPNNTGITEEDIKEARFEPKQETPE